MSTLEWRHSDAQRQWVCMYDDDVYEPRLLAYVTDEFLSDVAMSPDELRNWLAQRYRTLPPLPPEAFASNAVTGAPREDAL